MAPGDAAVKNCRQRSDSMSGYTRSNSSGSQMSTNNNLFWVWKARWQTNTCMSLHSGQVSTSTITIITITSFPSYTMIYNYTNHLIFRRHSGPQLDCIIAFQGNCQIRGWPEKMFLSTTNNSPQERVQLHALGVQSCSLDCTTAARTRMNAHAKLTAWRMMLNISVYPHGYTQTHTRTHLYLLLLSFSADTAAAVVCSLFTHPSLRLFPPSASISTVHLSTPPTRAASPTEWTWFNLWPQEYGTLSAPDSEMPLCVLRCSIPATNCHVTWLALRVHHAVNWNAVCHAVHHCSVA